MYLLACCGLLDPGRRGRLKAFRQQLSLGKWVVEAVEYPMKGTEKGPSKLKARALLVR